MNPMTRDSMPYAGTLMITPLGRRRLPNAPSPLMLTSPPAVSITPPVRFAIVSIGDTLAVALCSARCGLDADGGPEPAPTALGVRVADVGAVAGHRGDLDLALFHERRRRSALERV